MSESRINIGWKNIFHIILTTKYDGCTLVHMVAKLKDIKLRDFPAELWKRIKIAAISDNMTIPEWLAKVAERELNKKAA